MKRELRPLLIELCYLAAKRNAINVRRHRARFRKNYYEHALRVVEAHNESSIQLRHMERHNAHGHFSAKINSIKLEMAGLRLRHPNPKKWKDMGLHKLRSLILKNEGEYALAKHETMEFTIKNRERVQYLTEKLKCSVNYDNGSITSITFDYKVNMNGLDLEQINSYADEYELNTAVQRMIEE